MKGKEIIRSLIVVFCILIICIAVLVIFNLVTDETALSNSEAQTQAICARLLPEDEEFAEYEEAELLPGVLGVWHGTKTSEYAIKTEYTGAGGTSRVMLGIDEDGAISGIAVIKVGRREVGAAADLKKTAYKIQYLGACAITDNKQDLGAAYIKGIDGAAEESEQVFACVQLALAQYAVIRGEVNEEGGTEDGKQASESVQ